MALYDRSLKAWPVPCKTMFVSTSFGETHVVVAGPEEGEPMVLLHGKGASSTMWGPNIAALSAAYRVYAVDIIGDVGKNKPKMIFSDRSGFADWMTQALDKLKIERTSMVGHSMGAFLTASYALERPERLKKIVLLAPAATFSPFSKVWLLKALFTGLSGLDYFIKRFIRNLSATGDFMDSEWMAQGLTGVKFEKVQMKFPPSALSDEDIKNLSVPTLLVVGEKEIINRYRADLVIERAERLMENVQTVLISNAVHLINIEEPELVNSKILDFFSQDK